MMPRELYDAAVAAGLSMPGLYLQGSSFLRASGDNDDGDCGWAASLADVECAVMDALESKGLYAKTTKSGWCVTKDMGRGYTLTRLSTFEPTRAAALKAACEALAKEKATNAS